MNPSPLPRCTPESVGVLSRAVLDCLRALCHEQTTMNGFMAARHGKVFAECWWAPYGPDLVHCNHSFGKSYTATAIGIAAGEGLVKLDERMVDIFADEIEARGIVPAEGVDRITVEHVLTMTNGMARMPDMRGDFIAHYFSTPVVHEPGTRFLYNSTGSCMLGAIVEKRSGQSLKQYLTPRLFEKIGIDPDAFVWRRFRDLPIDAEPGTFARTEDNLRLAMLYLNGGRWNGNQVLPEDFVRRALSVHVSTADAPEQKDGRCGYGYQLWACSLPGLYRFDGGQGQFGLIWPEKDIVVSIHEGAMGPRGPQMTLDAVYDTIFAALSEEPLPENPADLETLRTAERAAALPDDPVGGAPDTSFSGKYAVTAGEFDPWLSASPHRAFWPGSHRGPVPVGPQRLRHPDRRLRREAPGPVHPLPLRAVGTLRRHCPHGRGRLAGAAHPLAQRLVRDLGTVHEDGRGAPRRHPQAPAERNGQLSHL